MSKECTGQFILGWESCPASPDDIIRSTCLEGFKKFCVQCKSGIEEAATTDELTHAKNWLALKTTTAKLIRQKEPFCLIQFDLKNFGEVNKSLGHVAGDSMLIYFTHYLENGTRTQNKQGSERSNDITFPPYRKGGDEFTVLAILRDKNKRPVENPIDVAGDIAIRLRSGFEGFLTVDNEGKEIRPFEEYNSKRLPDEQLGLRVGVSVWQQGKTLSDLLIESDPKTSTLA